MSIRDFWSQSPEVAKGLALLTATTGALVGVGQAWPVVEPYVLAHRQYVRDAAEDEGAKLRRTFDPMRIALIDVQISIARSRRSTINDRLISLEIDAPKSESAAELVKRRQQINQLKDELNGLDDEIKSLRYQREKS